MTARQLVTSAFLLTLAAAPASAQPSGARSDRNPSRLLAPFQSVVAAANASTVRIRCEEKDTALGTVVSADGYILTKASELRGVLAVKLADGTVLDAEIVSTHKLSDLALLKVGTKGLTPVTFADSKKVPVGHWLAAAGLGTNPTAVGIVSVMTRDLGKANEDLLRNINRGYLSVMMAPADDEDGGAVVESVSDDGAAAKAGIKAKDVIFELDGLEITGQKALRDLLENYRPGDKIKLKLRRKGEVMEFKATLTGPPKSRSDIQNAMGGELSGRRLGFPAVLQTDMVIDPKNCGGPVVDLDGKVLGISIARAGRVETWILPAETIRPILEDMKAGKYPPVAVKKVVRDKVMNETNKNTSNDK